MGDANSILNGQKLLFIGGGAMGSAIIRGLLDTDACTAAQIAVSEPLAAQRAYLEHEFGVTTLAHNEQAIQDRDLVVLSIKPQTFAAVGAEIAPDLRSDALLISIMAGMSLQRMIAVTGHARIVRAMPNTPAQVQAGMTVWTATDAVSTAQRATAHSLFTAIGEHFFTAQEADLDRATALSGSGPGYIFLILEAMIDAGVQIGLSRNQALQLAVQTIWGSVQLVRSRPDRHLAEWRNLVTSPAGTTAAGLHELERGALRATMADAIAAAYQRSRELDA